MEKKKRNKIRILGKKAQSIRDVILVIVLLFVLAISFTAVIFIQDKITPQLKDNPTVNSSDQAVAILDNTQATNTQWDYLILSFFVGSILSFLILGWFIDINSIFFPIYIIATLISIPIAGVISYAWTQFSGTSTFFLTVSTKMPITNHLLENAIVYFIVLAFVALIATYAKTRNNA